jgi:Rho GTPase-activating protein RGD1
MQSKFAPQCSFGVLLSILSLSIITTPQPLQEASVFFKKRAMLEEEFGRGMQKLAKNTADIYAMNDGKAGCVNPIPVLSRPFRSQPDNLHTGSSFVNAWQTTMKIHEIVAENRLRFASRLNEMSEELANLAKEVDKNRKAVHPNLIYKLLPSFTRLSRPRNLQPGTNVTCRIPK